MKGSSFQFDHEPKETHKKISGIFEDYKKKKNVVPVQ